MPTDFTHPFAEFVRAHHVHFDVSPEVAFGKEERWTVGFLVRLWAVHDKGDTALPGCPKCVHLVEDLRRLAESVCPHELRPTQSEIPPFERALYDSKEVPGADEVAVTIRLTHRENYAAPVDACEERCLREIRAGLKAAGARER